MQLTGLLRCTAGHPPVGHQRHRVSCAHVPALPCCCMPCTAPPAFLLSSPGRRLYTHHLRAAPTRRLALLIPAAQSVTADYNPAVRRGRAFGLLHLTGALGALIGTVFGTNVGSLRPLGVDGWRIAFGAVGLASWAIGASTLALGVDPRYSQDPKYR